jgi:hypothetical protein
LHESIAVRKVFLAPTDKRSAAMDSLAFHGGGRHVWWFMEVGQAGDLEKASDAFKRAGAIVDRRAGV